MQNYVRSVAAVAIILFLFQGSFAGETIEISPDEFADRRASFLAQAEDDAVAVFVAALQKIRSNNIEYEYRQDNSLYYLTGIRDLQTALVLVKGGVEIDGKNVREILFIPPSNPRLGAMLGEHITDESAKQDLGFEVVKPYNSLGQFLEKILNGRKVLYYDFQVDFLYEPVSDERYFIGQKSKKALKEIYPDLKVQSPAKILTPLRQVKSPAELQLLQKAIDITGEAHIAAMSAARAGMFEYELEAIIEYVFKRRGAEYPAFPSIVGSGPNAIVLHHWTNRRQTERGDLVVIDIGAEFRGYSADVTRTIPISGKFTKEQREIYDIVLNAQKKAIDCVKPGVPFRQVHKVAKQVIDTAGYGQYFNHGTSHFLGLDTHDVGDYKELLPGMVITVEPGIYIREGSDIDKKYWNIGVRIEDDILVTPDGCKILSDKAPREIEEIEELMQQKARFSLELE